MKPKVVFLNPTAKLRWGFLFWALALGLLAGCSQTPSIKSCIDPATIRYSASEDSLGLAAFLELTPGERQSRRVQARISMDRFDESDLAHVRIGALGNAAGLAPDHPGTWLQLAHIWRWLGDYLKTLECLDAASEAVGQHQPDIHTWDKKEFQRRIALARAWLHYDRGEWRQGLRWARAVLRTSPGDASAKLIYGLLAGHSSLRSEAQQVARDFAMADDGDQNHGWVLASYRASTSEYREAFNLVMDLTPRGEKQSECWREMGEIAEMLGEYSRAGRWYEESAHGLPFRDTSCLSWVKHSRLRPGSKKKQQKVWLAFGKFYVTGSYSAYTSLAYQRFRVAEDANEKDFWAGQVVNATGTLLRKGIDMPWAYRTRGLVLAFGGKTDRSIKDLNRASDLLGKIGRQDKLIEATLGRLLLKKEDHIRAIPHLRKAIELDNTVARPWQDLGLALIMADEPEEAETALSKALQLDPKSTTSWYNRGLLHLHRKDYGLAVADLEKAAALAPDNREVINLLQKAHALDRQDQN